MVWLDGFTQVFKGTRTHALAPSPTSGTHVAMDEVFSGGMLKFIKSSLPDFAPVFERCAQALKREAERGSRRP